MPTNGPPPAGRQPQATPMLMLMKRRKTVYRLRRRKFEFEPVAAAEADSEQGAMGGTHLQAHSHPADPVTENVPDPKMVARIRSLEARIQLLEASLSEATTQQRSVEAALASKSDELVTITGRFDVAQKQIEEMKSIVQRTRSDMDFLRRRTQKEKEDLQKFASEEILTMLIPFFDNFTMAVALAQNGQDPQALVSGVSMIHRELMKNLDQQGFCPLEAIGKPFDPNCHDAVNTVTDTNYDDGTVMQILRPGYLLNGKVLRAAMVSVNKLPQGAGGTSTTSTPHPGTTPLKGIVPVATRVADESGQLDDTADTKDLSDSTPEEKEVRMISPDSPIPKMKLRFDADSPNASPLERGRGLFDSRDE